MINSWQSFMTAVVAMRDAQKTYFRTRSSTDLNIAKRLESAVDKAIEQHETRTKPVQIELGFNQTQSRSPGLPVFAALHEGEK